MSTEIEDQVKIYGEVDDYSRGFLFRTPRRGFSPDELPAINIYCQCKNEYQYNWRQSVLRVDEILNQVQYGRMLDRTR